MRDFDLGDFVDTPKQWEHTGRNTRFAIAAATQAVRDASLEGNGYDPTRFGVYLGSGEGQQDFFLFTDMMVDAWKDGELDLEAFTASGLRRMHPEVELEQEPNMTAGHLAALFGAEGPNLNCLTACAASSQAIGEAVEIIRRGDADAMLAGGSEAGIVSLAVAGFNKMDAMSKRNDDPEHASRPFDLNRDGFVLGEGSAQLVLESFDHAKARGAKILAEVVGYGSTNDAHHITAPAENGAGAAASMILALENAQLDVDKIDYINAHGTSTKLNDKSETAAIKTVFGETAYDIPVSSTKSMTGHMLGAAGGMEAIFCVKAMEESVLPPTINYETPDPECDLDYVPNNKREKDVEYAMSNSFGFGGHNATLVFAKVLDDQETDSTGS